MDEWEAMYSAMQTPDRASVFGPPLSEKDCWVDVKMGCLLAVENLGDEMERAELLQKVGKKKEEVRLTVRLVDCAEKIWVPSSKAWVLPRKFCKVPPTAVRCKLHNVSWSQIQGRMTKSIIFVSYRSRLRRTLPDIPWRRRR